jgi:hypothetical protein
MADETTAVKQFYTYARCYPGGGSFAVPGHPLTKRLEKLSFGVDNKKIIKGKMEESESDSDISSFSSLDLSSESEE